MVNKLTCLAQICLFLLFSLDVGAVESIEGLWQQIDDKTGKIHSLLRINTKDGETSAVIVKGYPTSGDTQDANERCIACPGEFKDKPLYGLRILWGLKRDGQEWSGGQILDPDEKQIYSVMATLSPDGDTLKVRGYLGLSLFGRTQVWRRFRENLN